MQDNIEPGLISVASDVDLLADSITLPANNPDSVAALD
jgi:hypothetical protein